MNVNLQQNSQLRETDVFALHPQDTLCSVEEKFENTNFELRIKHMECYFSRRWKSFMGGLTIRTISTSQAGLP